MGGESAPVAAPSPLPLPSPSREAPSHPTEPGAGLPFRPQVALNGAPKAPVGGEGDADAQLASAVPRALIKAVVLMASHDGGWASCHLGRRVAAQLEVGTDADGIMDHHDVQGGASPLDETLRRALSFLSMRRFSGGRALRRFAVTARCGLEVGQPFEVADTATPELAEGHVRFSTGVRVDFAVRVFK